MVSGAIGGSLGGLFSVFWLPSPELPFTLRDQVGASVGAAVLTLLAVWLATLSYTVSRSELLSRSIFGTKRMVLKDVESVRVQFWYGNTILLGYNVLVFSRSGPRSIGVAASVFGNRHELVKAVIEAATLANSNVYIDPELIARYGQPPYGIFTSKEKP